jgi:hypothetical protein
MKRLALAPVLLLLTLPLPAVAKDDFRNLPGVHDPAKMKDEPLDIACTSRLERRWPSGFPERNGLAYRTYRCEQGRLTIGSGSPPNLIEYRKYKQYYQSR